MVQPSAMNLLGGMLLRGAATSPLGHMSSLKPASKMIWHTLQAIKCCESTCSCSVLAGGVAHRGLDVGCSTQTHCGVAVQSWWSWLCTMADSSFLCLAAWPSRLILTMCRLLPLPWQRVHCRRAMMSGCKPRVTPRCWSLLCRAQLVYAAGRTGCSESGANVRASCTDCML